ncbi:MAG TPA: HNH endonuclease signature motif containing protein, partial [Nocardioides sp.]
IDWASLHPAETDPASLHPACGPHAYAEPAVDDRVDPARTPADLHDANGWHGIPAIAWHAPAAFAAANRLTTRAGGLLIRDALLLAHRLPRTWARVNAGHVPAWRARRVAATIAGQPDDVAAYVDHHVADVAERVGTATLDKLLTEALLRLHAEDVELDQLTALDTRHATLHAASINHTGIAEMTLRADWCDLAALDDTLTEVAHALDQPDLAATVGLERATLGTHHDERRALALGVLADPHAAATLLDAVRHTTAGTHDATSTDAARGPTATRMRTVLHLHLSDLALLGLDPVGRAESIGRSRPGGSGSPILAEVVRSWAGRTDTHLTVLPILDTSERITVDAYEIPDRLRRHVLATHTTCAFPWCEQPARTTDLDHITAWQPDDPLAATSAENLAPLCRHHQRHKTLAAWRYVRIETGTYHWTDPHGSTYVVTPHGTRPIAPHPRR